VPGLRSFGPPRLGVGGLAASSSLPLANVIVFDSSPGTAAHGEWPTVFAAARPDLIVVNRSEGGAELETHVVSPSPGLVQGLIDNFDDWIVPYKHGSRRNILLLAPGAMLNRFVYNFDDGNGHVWGHGFTNGASVVTAANGVNDVIALAWSHGIYTVPVAPYDWYDGVDYVQAEVSRGIGQVAAACMANTGGALAVLDFRSTTPTFDPVTNDPAYFTDGIHPSVPLGRDAIGTRIAALSVGRF
jgi:hypothetical protein